MNPQLSFLDEIIVDCFAGGGGWSWGIEQATGRPVDIAVNHDPDAILMHKTNHPYTRHYCENIYAVDPVRAAAGRPVGWAHFSPDCKHFSKAKGGKPVEKKIRGLAWVTLRWAGLVRPRIISMENVEEFVTWGPVRKGKPVKAKQGETFKKFISQLKALGYVVEWQTLKACDYGAPTIRKRFFLLARCDGRPIAWPEPTHGDPESEAVKSEKLKPFRTAAEIIDWSLPCPSIFERKRPLAENTMRRITKGLDKFVIKNPAPFIVQVNHGGGNFRGQPAAEPLHTVTAKHGYGVTAPVLTKFQQNSIGQPPDRPVDTIMAGATRFGVVSPVLVGVGGRAGQSPPRELTNPTGTTTSKADVALVTPHLIQYHQEQKSGGHRGQSVKKPLLTVDGSNRYGVAAPVMTAIGHTGFSGDRSFSPLEPTRTCVTKQEQCLVTAYISKYYGGNYSGNGSPADEPVHTVTAQDHNALASAHIIKMRGDNTGQKTDAPLQTITAGGKHFANVQSYMTQYHGKGTGQPTNIPLGTVTSRDHFGHIEVKTVRLSEDFNGDAGYWPRIRDMLNRFLDYGLREDEILVFTIGGAEYILVDIGLRMLSPRELYNAQGFPSDYIIDRDLTGKPYPKNKQVARCGNAVPPPFAAALVRANWPEKCKGVFIDSVEQFKRVVAI